jgi:hypothetical protein
MQERFVRGSVRNGLLLSFHISLGNFESVRSLKFEEFVRKIFGRILIRNRKKKLQVPTHLSPTLTATKTVLSPKVFTASLTYGSASSQSEQKEFC